ncbi:hypothetical protein ABER68_05855 [Paenibacillus alvei]
MSMLFKLFITQKIRYEYSTDIQKVDLLLKYLVQILLSSIVFLLCLFKLISFNMANSLIISFLWINIFFGSILKSYNDLFDYTINNKVFPFFYIKKISAKRLYIWLNIYHYSPIYIGSIFYILITPIILKYSEISIKDFVIGELLILLSLFLLMNIQYFRLFLTIKSIQTSNKITIGKFIFSTLLLFLVLILSGEIIHSVSGFVLTGNFKFVISFEKLGEMIKYLPLLFLVPFQDSYNAILVITLYSIILLIIFTVNTRYKPEKDFIMAKIVLEKNALSKEDTNLMKNNKFIDGLLKIRYLNRNKFIFMQIIRQKVFWKTYIDYIVYSFSFIVALLLYMIFYKNFESFLYLYSTLYSIGMTVFLLINLSIDKFILNREFYNKVSISKYSYENIFQFTKIFIYLLVSIPNILIFFLTLCFSNELSTYIGGINNVLFTLVLINIYSLLVLRGNIKRLNQTVRYKLFTTFCLVVLQIKMFVSFELLIEEMIEIPVVLLEYVLIILLFLILITCEIFINYKIKKNTID